MQGQVRARVVSAGRSQGKGRGVEQVAATTRPEVTGSLVHSARSTQHSAAGEIRV